MKINEPLLLDRIKLQDRAEEAKQLITDRVVEVEFATNDGAPAAESEALALAYGEVE